MLFVLFSAPVCLLSFYLAFLCFRKALYPHTVVLTVIAVFMLLFTLGVLGAGFLANQAIQDELASLPACVLPKVT